MFEDDTNGYFAVTLNPTQRRVSTCYHAICRREEDRQFCFLQFTSCKRRQQVPCLGSSKVGKDRLQRVLSVCGARLPIPLLGSGICSLEPAGRWLDDQYRFPTKIQQVAKRLWRVGINGHSQSFEHRDGSSQE